MEAKSFRGKRIDMNKLLMQNEKAVALGNAKLNARGDVLGKGGKIVKTREQIAREYHEKNPNAVKQVSIHANSAEDEKAAREFKEMSEAPVRTKSSKIEEIDSNKVAEKTKTSKPIDFD